MSEQGISQVFIARKMLIEEEGETYFNETKRCVSAKLCVFCGKAETAEQPLKKGGSHHEVCRRRGWGEAQC